MIGPTQEDMEGGESPLDVLSRAATMIQENQALSTVGTEDCSKPYSQKPSTKWKRERRPRLTEYNTLRSDPKFSDTFSLETSRLEITDGIYTNTNRSKPNNASIEPNSSGIAPDTPLDMSVRHRGLPPSYAQTVNNPGYRSNYRASVIHNGVPSREDLPSGISMCDPIIDEHFRRSLGNDYQILFQTSNASKEQIPPKSPPRATSTNVIEMMDNTGLSVDDHFAKALGETWAKLNRKEPEMKGGTSETGLVSI